MYKIKLKYFKGLHPELKFWAVFDVISVDTDLKDSINYKVLPNINEDLSIDMKQDSINYQVLPDINEDLSIDMKRGFTHMVLPEFKKMEDLEKYIKGTYIIGIKAMINDKRQTECEKVILPDEKIIEL